MNQTQAIIDVLEAQFNILNIEGFTSAHYIYNYEEDEIIESTCSTCDGQGDTEPENWSDLVWDKDLMEYTPAPDLTECKNCDGTGTILKTKTHILTDSYTESNIII